MALTDSQQRALFTLALIPSVQAITNPGDLAAVSARMAATELDEHLTAAHRTLDDMHASLEMAAAARSALSGREFPEILEEIEHFERHKGGPGFKYLHDLTVEGLTYFTGDPSALSSHPATRKFFERGGTKSLIGPCGDREAAEAAVGTILLMVTAMILRVIAEWTPPSQ